MAKEQETDQETDLMDDILRRLTTEGHKAASEAINSNVLAYGDTVDVWHFGKRFTQRRSTNEQFPLVGKRRSDV